MRVFALVLLALCACEPAGTQGGVDSDGDGSFAGADCDDRNPGVHPGAVELCNGVDEDCDGGVDEGVLTLWFRDFDEDGFGDPNQTAQACEPLLGVVGNGNDCNDNDPRVHPNATEYCDGIDNDCDDGEADALDAATWYADFDRDGFGDPYASTKACEAPANHVTDATDCDDSSADAFPGGEERCDGLDNDCDGDADGPDAVDAVPWYEDGDGDGHAGASASESVLACDAPEGFAGPRDDCDDADPSVHPGATERCDDVDEDCNGLVDDSATDAARWYADADGDGFGGGTSVVACDAPDGYADADGDCDDADAATNPSAVEVCNGFDDDCDGLADPPFVDSDLDAPLAGEIVLNGDAKQKWAGSDGVLELTDTTAENGGAFLASHVPGDVWYATFTADFAAGNGGEGMAFAFLDEPDPTVKGDDGEGLGVRGLTGWALAFDTYRNGTSDPKDDHLSLVLADDLSEIAAASPIPSLHGAGPRTVEIWFDQGDVVVAIDGLDVLDATVPGYVSTDLLLGVTAATSGHWDRHEIDDLLVGCP